MDTKTFCPGCSSHNNELIYQVNNIPIASCLMQNSAQKAEDFACADIELALCNQCGFIFNKQFDPKLVNYDSSYEPQQCYSPTFNKYATTTATKLIAKYDLHHKNIVEIGCGKGDFLASLCELGDNRGIGIDPSYIPGRIEASLASKITVFRDYFSIKHAPYLDDFILCRHTLEHINNTGSFMAQLRHAIGPKRQPTVYFEVPSSLRILQESAFWDIYYEHCSYFTKESLAQLFSNHGFAIIDISYAYDHQVLQIAAKPVNDIIVDKQHQEETINELASLAQRFASSCYQKINQWRQRLTTFHQQHKKVALWGSGSKCVSFVTTLDVDHCISNIVDINPHRHGKYAPGLTTAIQPADSLRKVQPDIIVIMNPIYLEEIRDMLMAMQVKAEILTL